MKKILFVTENLYCGGVEKCLVELLDNISHDKYEIDLLLFNECGSLIDKVNKNVTIKYIIPNDKYKFRVINKIYKSIKTRLYRNFPKLINYELRNENYDIEIAYIHGYITQLVSCIRSKAKKIAWIHTDIKKCEVAQSSNLGMYLPKFDDIICVSKGVKDSIDEIFPTIKEKSKVIYNIIDSNKIRKLANEKVDFTFKENTIIGIGRFYSVKRFDLIIKAQKLLKDDGIKSNVLLVGYGGALSEYEKLIEELEIEDCVEIIGFKDNPYPYMFNSDIFVLSSDHEGLPTVVGEAMCLGKAIISTKCAGAVELIDNNRNGILVSCGDEYELKEAIKYLIQNKIVKKTMEYKSLKRFEIFNRSTILKEIEAVFEYKSK